MAPYPSHQMPCDKHFRSPLWFWNEIHMPFKRLMQSVCEMPEHPRGDQRSTSPVLPWQLSPPWFLFAFVCFIFFETGSLVGLRFFDLGRLADQQAQGIVWSHPPGLGLLECATHPSFYVGCGDWTWVSLLVWKACYQVAICSAPAYAYFRVKNPKPIKILLV